MTPVAGRTSVSRYFAIVAAYGVAFYQASRGNWFEVAGLLGLGTGLILLIVAGHDGAGRTRRPGLRWAAWACFALTLAAVIYVARRDY
jgi:hypothetical protein